jgi:hypothetical protein
MLNRNPATWGYVIVPFGRRGDVRKRTRRVAWASVNLGIPVS